MAIELSEFYLALSKGLELVTGGLAGIRVGYNIVQEFEDLVAVIKGHRSAYTYAGGKVGFGLSTNTGACVVDLILRVRIVTVGLLDYLLSLGFEYRVYAVGKDRGVGLFNLLIVVYAPRIDSRAVVVIGLSRL